MKVDIAQLLKSLGLEDRVELSYNFKFDEEESFKLASSVKLNLKLVGINEGILVTGKAETEVDLNCARCGKLYTQVIEFEIEEEYKLPHLVLNKGDVFLDDAVFEIEDEKYIDLTEAVRQGILINLPLKGVCSIECHTEKDLQNNKEPDPRLNKLKEFKEKNKN